SPRPPGPSRAGTGGPWPGRSKLLDLPQLECAPLEVWVVADELYAIVVAVGLEQPEATDHLLAGDVRSVRHPHRTALCANHAALAFLQLLARNQLALAAQALAPLDVATDARLDVRRRSLCRERLPLLAVTRDQQVLRHGSTSGVAAVDGGRVGRVLPSSI